jgi:sodium/hydrogen antiporter
MGVRSPWMNAYPVVLAGFGAIVLLTAWLPMVLKELPLSLPIFCVGLGVAIFAIPSISGYMPHPMEQLGLIEHLSEIVVIISLMGAGLSFDEAFSWSRWRLTWRLLGIAMPLTILGLAILGHTVLGLGAATALLLAAALAPTDPVLASDVAIGPPGEGEEDEVRFALTSEAGLNDGLAFPFVLLAMALVTQGNDLSSLAAWFTIAVVWKIAAGIGIGYLVGKGLGWLTFNIPNRAKLSRTGSGFVVLGITCLAYGIGEIAHGYGFIAVFVAALALRASKRGHDYHRRLHNFAEETERLLMMVMLVLLGATAASGDLFRALDGRAVIFMGLAIFVVRPLSGWIGLIGTGRPVEERMAISFFGIRGIGSIYYLAYALNRARFEQPDLLWSTVGLIILVSIVLHGITVTPVMRRLDDRQKRHIRLP